VCSAGDGVALRRVPDGLDDLVSGAAGAEDGGHAGVEQVGDVDVGHDATDDDGRAEPPLPEGPGTTLGASVRWAALCIDRPTTSTSSCSEAAAIISGVCRSPA
jgi:hypothetical protein